MSDTTDPHMCRWKTWYISAHLYFIIVDEKAKAFIYLPHQPLRKAGALFPRTQPGSLCGLMTTFHSSEPLRSLPSQVASPLLTQVISPPRVTSLGDSVPAILTLFPTRSLIALASFVPISTLTLPRVMCYVMAVLTLYITIS